jgi:hypothetical protein
MNHRPYDPEWERRFWLKVDRRGDDECWPWLACTIGKGSNRRGQVTAFAGFPRRFMTAGRAAYLIAFGEFDLNLSVCHKCDVPLCVNPAHLFLGTQRDNLRDCIRKGRFNPKGVRPTGNYHHRSKINERVAAEIRAAYAAGESTPKIARRIGVGISTVGDVVRGVRWALPSRENRAALPVSLRG